MMAHNLKVDSKCIVVCKCIVVSKCMVAHKIMEAQWLHLVIRLSRCNLVNKCKMDSHLHNFRLLCLNGSLLFKVL